VIGVNSQVGQRRLGYIRGIWGAAVLALPP
jgi:hypothetical protein